MEYAVPSTKLIKRAQNNGQEPTIHPSQKLCKLLIIHHFPKKSTEIIGIISRKSVDYALHTVPTTRNKTSSKQITRVYYKSVHNFLAGYTIISRGNSWTSLELTIIAKDETIITPVLTEYSPEANGRYGLLTCDTISLKFTWNEICPWQLYACDYWFFHRIYVHMSWRKSP